MNQYEPLDLIAFDPELAGKTLSILRNPTRGFRLRFLPAVGDEFLSCIAEILDCEVAEIEPMFAGYEDALFKWLFLPVMGSNGKWILPYVYALWDDASEKKVMALRSQSPPRVIAPNGTHISGSQTA